MMGVFRKADGRIFVVKPNREKTKLYAKEIIESAPRMTEAGEVVDFETVYRPGAIYDLNESERWDLAEAQNFLTRYARCIVCGAHLKAAKSVAGAIGPVCAKYFKRQATEVPGVNNLPAVGVIAPTPPVEEFDEARAEMIANGIDPDGGPDCTTNDGDTTIVIDLVAELKKRLMKYDEAEQARTINELARFGFTDYRASRISPGAGIAERADGYKVAVDFATGGWMWYRGRRDPSREGEGFADLFNWLVKNS
jgi:hypothetical protein